MAGAPGGPTLFAGPAPSYTYAVAGAPAAVIAPDQRWRDYVRMREIHPDVAQALHDALFGRMIKVVCDDSSSMGLPIAEEGVDPMAPKRSTRILELKRLVVAIVDLVTALNPDGLDLHFLNRPPLLHVTTSQALAPAFVAPPSGQTPLIGVLNQLFDQCRKRPAGHDAMLVVVITDGEPSDGTRQDLYNCLMNMPLNCHCSFTECTDSANDMEYLEAWNGLIPRFDNSEDYREETNRIVNIQGSQFKFGFQQYVEKILLATFVMWYFRLDQQRVGPLQALQFRNQPQQVSLQNYSGGGAQGAASSAPYYDPIPAASRAAVAQQYYMPPPQVAAQPQQASVLKDCCVIL